MSFYARIQREREKCNLAKKVAFIMEMEADLFMVSFETVNEE